MVFWGRGWLNLACQKFWENNWLFESGIDFFFFSGSEQRMDSTKMPSRKGRNLWSEDGKRNRWTMKQMQFKSLFSMLFFSLFVFLFAQIPSKVWTRPQHCIHMVLYFCTIFKVRYFESSHLRPCFPTLTPHLLCLPSGATGVAVTTLEIYQKGNWAVVLTYVWRKHEAEFPKFGCY